MKFKLQTIVVAVFFGMASGYILCLWQQAARHAHRETCPACREIYHAD